MKILKKSEEYFYQIYNKLCLSLEDKYNGDLEYYVRDILKLDETEFHKNFETIMSEKEYIGVFEKLKLINDGDKIIIIELPYSCSKIFYEGIQMFYLKSYYNSLISIPIFDYIFNIIAPQFFNISNSIIEKKENGVIEETFKSTSTILKIIKNTGLYEINTIFDVLFTNSFFNNDIRSIYSHYLFKNENEVKLLSYIYYTFIINYVLLDNLQELIYVKRNKDV